MGGGSEEFHLVSARPLADPIPAIDDHRIVVDDEQADVGLGHGPMLPVGRARPAEVSLDWVRSALVAQGIEHRPPEPGAQVRILPRARCAARP